MIEQIVIACTGLPAVWLSQDTRENWRRYACLFGLAGQPFWMYATLTAQQWGMFALTLFYTYAWGKGVRNHWLKGGEHHGRR